MTLSDDWKEVLQKAWSIRFLIVAFVLTAAEVVLPFFIDSLPRGIFAALSGLTVAGAFVARLLAQRNMP